MKRKFFKHSSLFSDTLELPVIFRNIRSYDVRRSKEHLSGNSLKTPSGTTPAVFITPNSTVVFAQIGGTAKLPCVVRKFNNGVVSAKNLII